MIGIIFIGNLKYCPYLDKYLKVLDNSQTSYEVIFWDREYREAYYSTNYIAFKKKSNLNKHKLFKLLDFTQFAIWLDKLIDEKKYSKLIVLSTLSGIFIANTLLKRYQNRYIFDIRDYSYEGVKPFYRLEKKIIDNSYFTCISSEGFKEFLPRGYEYIMAHNFNYNDLQFQREFKKKKKGSTINVVWNGSIRYFDHQSQIIDRLKNDARFNIFYHGTGPEIDMFKNYCTSNNINNVIFTGEYQNSNKHKLLNDADILNNSYGIKKEMEIKYAISNKFYDGIIYGIPQLVEENTFKHRKVKKLKVGIGLDVRRGDFADKLYDYYFSIDEERFNFSCKKELSRILEEDKLYLSKIQDFVFA